jgi:hypothetical protein
VRAGEELPVDGTFRTNEDGEVFFRTHGWRMPVRKAEGNRLRVTLRVGGRCAQATAALRTKKAKLLFP